MITIDALREYGADVDDGLKRCMNNETFYLALVPKAVGDDTAERLAEAVQGERYKEAFEIAHGLKGVAGNLGLAPIYGPASALTELLRGEADPGRADEFKALSEKILEEKNKLAALCK